MHLKHEFVIEDVGEARALVREQPFATIVTADLQATHMPCLVDDGGDELVIESHVALADPVAASIDGPVLMILRGVHGYVSASWYDNETIPTWNHVTLHLRGTPVVLEDAMPLLRRTVDHFERRVERPWQLERLGDRALEMSRQVVAFRLRAESWHLERKLSQDKPADERERIVSALEAPGPYANSPLAAAMRAART